MSASEVRVAAPGDSRSLATIKVAGWRAAYRGLLPDSVLDGLDVDRTTDLWATSIGSLTAPSGCLVVLDRDVVAGYAAFGPYRWEEPDDPMLRQAGEIYAFYVDPGRWGRGLGRRLMTATQERLEDAGLDDQALWVLETNQAGRRFYEALGWSWDGARGDRCELDDAPEVRYRNARSGPTAPT